MKTAAGKRELSTQALTLIKSISDPVEQEHYLRRVGEVTGASMRALQGKLTSQVSATIEKPLKPVKIELRDAKNDPAVHQDYLLGLACIDASVHDTLRHLEPEAVSGSVRRMLMGYILENRGKPMPDPLPKDLHEIETYVKIVTFKAETRYGSVDINDRLIEAAHLVHHVQKEQRKAIKQQLDHALRDAEATGDMDRANTIRQQLHGLIKEMKRAQR